jgi:4-hydroxy-tetrahydrodipicolinate synthase
MFRGSIVALVTPFRNGAVDEERLRELVEFHIARGTNALLPCGTTGESPTLSYEEHDRVIQVVVEQARKRVPVIGGTGSNSTTETLELSEHAMTVGCDAVLLVAPYYNRPTQEGLFQHFTTVARRISLPIILYNIPGRSAVNIEPETAVRIAAAASNIAGIKEASGSIEQVSRTIRLLQEAGLDERVAVLSGDDSMTFPIMALGGTGVISVSANIIPERMRTLCDLMLNGSMEEARRLHFELYDLNKALFMETSPAPVKEAMAMMGMIEPDVRLPLVRVQQATAQKLRALLQRYRLTNIGG